MLAAKEVWRRFPGSWEVRVNAIECLGELIWEQAISNFISAAIQSVRVEKGGRIGNFSHSNRSSALATPVSNEAQLFNECQIANSLINK